MFYIQVVELSIFVWYDKIIDFINQYPKQKLRKGKKIVFFLITTI